MPDPAAPPYLWTAHGPGFVAQAEHTLRVTAWCSVAGVTLSIAAVVLGDDWSPRPFLYTLLPTNNRVATTVTPFPLEKGQLTSLQVFVSGGTVIGAQCFVRVELLQGREGGVTSLGTIVEGYVTNNVAVCYPGDNTSRAVDGRGTFRSVANAAPVAGADFVVTVPANTRWALVSIGYTLTASVAVANRLPLLVVDDGVNVLWITFNNTAVTASQAATYLAGAGVQLGTVTTLTFQIPLPEILLLPAGARIRSSTTAIQAADQFSQQFLNVEEWLDV